MFRQSLGKLFLLFAFFQGSSVLYGQSCDSMQWAQPGTYLVTIDSSAFEGTFYSPIMLSDQDLCLIESLRKPTEEIQIHIGIYLVTIYPKKKFADNTTDN